jgi:hypothetical protein
MLPMLGRFALQYGIPTISGLLTVKDIYEKTGDPGKALVGGGVAGAGTWGLGKLGTGLGNKFLTTPAILAKTPGALPAALGGGFGVAQSTLRAALPAAFQGVGGALGIPALAGGIAAGVTPGVFGPGASRKAGDALSGSMQLLGAGQQLTAPGATGEVNLAGPPSLGQYGPDSYMDVAAFNSPARGQMLRGEMEARSQLEQMKTLMPYQYEMITKAQNADLLRQGAGAQLRTRLAQGAQAMAQAQLGAQALAQQGNQAMLQAATMRGGYV